MVRFMLISKFPKMMTVIVFAIFIFALPLHASDVNKTCSEESSKKYADETRKRMDEDKWVLSVMNGGGFSGLLNTFYILNHRYPYDVDELLDSGLMLIWPADPSTGEPMKFVENKKLTVDDMGVISYIRESDSNAYFEYVLRQPGTDEYIVRNIPQAGLLSRNTENANRFMNIGRSDLLIQDNFRENMMSAFSLSLRRSEYRMGDSVPTDFAEAVNGNFFLIKENIKPTFINSNPDTPLFFECGIAMLDGKKVYFMEWTYTDVARGGFKVKDMSPLGEFDRHHVIINSITNPMEVISSDRYSQLTNKLYFYSTRLILDGTLEIPNEVLISKSEILGE